MDSTKMSGVVGIITRNRPVQLATCLAALRPQLTEGFRVVIVDNGDIPCGIDPDDRLDVYTSAPGYCIARNRVLEAAVDADVLIFLDDDQVVRDGWLDAFVRTYLAHQGSVITGYRNFVLPATVTDPALRDAVEMMNGDAPHEGAVDVAPTGNTLVPMAQWRACGHPYFREEFAAIGGEDTDFFTRLRRGGVEIWANPSIIVDEPIVASRLNRRWLVERCYNSGQARALIQIMSSPIAGRARTLTGGAARVTVGTVEGACAAARRGAIWPQDWYRAINGIAFLRQALKPSIIGAAPSTHVSSSAGEAR